jgi:hypothetical protein
MLKEADVIRAVKQWLSLHKIRHFRMNSGKLKNPSGRPVSFGETGMADLYALTKGVAIWIECKRPDGGVVSEEQHAFLDFINQEGCGNTIGIIVNSVESLEQQLKEAHIV